VNFVTNFGWMLVGESRLVLESLDQNFEFSRFLSWLSDGLLIHLH
jgi:hypothetical protein